MTKFIRERVQIQSRISHSLVLPKPDIEDNLPLDKPSFLTYKVAITCEVNYTGRITEHLTDSTWMHKPTWFDCEHISGERERTTIAINYLSTNHLADLRKSFEFSTQLSVSNQKI